VKTQHWVFWDGDCGICGQSVQWIRKRDKRSLFQVIPYQDAPEPPMTPELQKACKNAMHVVTAEGQIYRAGRACLFILEKLGWGIVARWLALPPMIWLVEIIYRLIANNRHRLSRLFKTKQCSR
jgi:predicted DCC family thiol-disulfide oxidoreductase YuxK